MPLPAEQAAVARAVPRRVGEFAAGRALARRAMIQIGLPPVAIPAGPDRAPIWPAGLCGTITHCADRCIAAVARRADGFRGLGLDVEPDEPLDADLLPLIATAEERADLATLPAAAALRQGRMIFSAKECAYKAQYALTRTLLDFQDLSISFAPDGTFTARFCRDVAPFRAGDALAGRIAVDGRHIVCASAIRD
ncbi:4'-phosphopantetheinyl transferase family protein [Antarcticirhabdus aurantiaca]|uniref:4'-phosphopantetheinyl transferase superfamily protein n=1 Tax=Antarcticirhabdus aurantiaca TaxID=2606717 RepID=A0ACD4NWF6_9HYPH|nr:4'-phosphopantetheinyl transferase superfamily protein [Antarcticirhabdus aurantiaca]WAJ31100.1 4'-phosphopantetheinyl transferase superfamily protein [Jeongeuplla avenae]